MSKLQRKIYQSYLNTLNRLPMMTNEDFRALRKAALTLHGWYEHECNGAIQRDGDDCEGAPYWHNTNTDKRICKAADRERGAIKRIKAVCQRLGLHYYLQTDPRGGTLYVDSQPIPENNYNRAVFIA